VLTKLFEPITVGPMQLKNRVVMTAMHLNYTPTGYVSDQFTSFYRARAQGGVGLIVIGGADINDQASGMDFMLSIKDDSTIQGFRQFTDAIHDDGGTVAVQLYMAGAYSFCGMKGLPVLAPSEYVSKFSRQKTTAMTLEDIERVQNDFVQATRRAKEAGFDAVEVLGSAGYLICQFLSPKTNKRDDQYGGSLENRMRFGRETVERVRKEAGPDMGVIVRVAGNDFVPASHTNTEACRFAKVVQDAGADMVNVTGGWHESRVPQITMDLPQAGYVYLARGIREAVDVPVVGCNRINDPLIAEDVLEEGVADLVGVARGLIADPDFVNKAKEGKFDEIRRCVACNQRCFDHVFMLQPVGCMVNPAAGKEAGTEIVPTDNPKKVLVAGAGPAGCEFACTAAERGHKVTLCDKENYLGGQVFWSAESTHKPEFMNQFRYYNALLDKYGVEVRLGTEVTPDLVAAEQPDLVVTATGAAPFKPPIEAVEARNVVQAWDVLKGEVRTGRNIVVVGGGSVGLECAVFLASKGTISPKQVYFLTMHDAETPEKLKELMTKGVKKVTVIEMAGRMGQDIGPSTRWVLLKDLEARGVDLITGATMKDITPDHVVYTDSEGRDVSVPANTVVLAMGSRPENSLSKALEGSGVEVRNIGDSNKVGRIGDAVAAGFELARSL
jgi:2,4-dienoyl-CoA reductase-like NADH-dependent reductase (Old Yellow Enzyme family)/NADH dehydrogenase FAD-containing subunit